MSSPARVVLIGPSHGGSAGRNWSRRALGRLKPDLLIAVDGGRDLLSEAPDIFVGDMDSLKKSHARLGLVSLRLPVDKERSDLWHALRTAETLLPRGNAKLACLGFLGGRLDHELAALLEIQMFASRGRFEAASVGLGRSARFAAPGTPVRFRRCIASDEVSVFCFAARNEIEIKGLRFAFRGALPLGSRGLSNRGTGVSAEIRAVKGSAIVLSSQEPRFAGGWLAW